MWSDCGFNHTSRRTRLCSQEGGAGVCLGQRQAVLVDEWQDVSPDQHALVLQMARHIRSVTVVGDENQAIYGFRGAVEESFEQFSRAVPGNTRLALTGIDLFYDLDG